MFIYLFSFCNCDDPDQKVSLDNDQFPSNDQLWGMIGTIFATLACWFIYSKIKIKPSIARVYERRERQSNRHKASVPATEARGLRFWK